MLLINLKLLVIANHFLLNVVEHENLSANNMKMPTIVDIFILAEQSSCSAVRAGHEKSFITSGPGLTICLVLSVLIFCVITVF